MIVDQLKCLEAYLKANNMENTLQSLRAELLSNFPNKPSQQFLSLLDEAPRSNEHSEHDSKPEKKNMRKKKEELPLEGLLGQIAYSSKLLEDNKINHKINQLMDNKIFLKAVDKMFPETNKAPNSHTEMHRDELEFASSVPKAEDSMKEGDHYISFIDINHDESSLLSQPSYVYDQLNRVNENADIYQDDNDLGYHQYCFAEDELMVKCAELTNRYGYPYCAVKTKGKKSTKKKSKIAKYMEGTVFPTSESPIYPLQYNGVNYDSMKLKVIFDREKIGYEETKEIEFTPGDILAGKFEVKELLGNGVFANVIRVRDLLTNQESCLKMLSNNKDFLDQALDEIKLLRYVKANYDPDKHHLLTFKDVFYHREHLFIQTDLLKDNLFTAYRKNPSFFSIPVIKQIARQILEASATLHSLQIIHADLKPENILIKSYQPVQIKVIDLGNSCFSHDSLGAYVQSRSYRAPEVILGTGYDEKIDIWSVGCILSELWTKNVLFYNLHIQGMLARMQSILGPWPEWMLESGQHVSNYFSKENLIFYEEDSSFHILIPKKTNLKSRIRVQNEHFVDFLAKLLSVDPEIRLSARQALQHPFLE